MREDIHTLLPVVGINQLTVLAGTALDLYFLMVVCLTLFFYFLIYEDIVQFLLMFKVLFTHDSDT